MRKIREKYYNIFTNLNLYLRSTYQRQYAL
jgi:hypothetical protein